MGKSKGQMKSRLSYSAGAFGNDVFYATLSTYFIMFVTTHLFNTGDPKQNSHYVLLITNIISILRILEVFIDPLIGNMIDNTNTKYGKFKPPKSVKRSNKVIELMIPPPTTHGLNLPYLV